MAKINGNKLGLVLGIFAAILHAVWAISVAVGVAQAYLDWIFPMHFIGNVFSVISFNAGTAILLIILAFVGGYVLGWIWAGLWNWLNKK